MLLLVSTVAIVAVTVAVAPTSVGVSLFHPPPQAEDPSILILCTTIACKRFTRIRVAVAVVAVVVACCTGGDGAVVVYVAVVSRHSSTSVGVVSRHDLLLLLVVFVYAIERLVSLCRNLASVCVCVCVCVFDVLIDCLVVGLFVVVVVVVLVVTISDSDGVTTASFDRSVFVLFFFCVCDGEVMFFTVTFVAKTLSS